MIRSSATLAMIALLMMACGGGGGGSDAGAGGGNAEPTPVGRVPAASQPSPVTPSTTEITLLALVSDGVRTMYPEPALRIQHVVNVANDVLASSQLDLRFSLVHIGTTDYHDDAPMPVALDDLTYGTDPTLAHVAALRDAHAADLVVLFRPYANDGHCGFAWIGGYQTDGDFSHPAEADYGYSVVAADCADYTLLHELGHNLGLAHSRREDPKGGSLPYGAGHGVDNAFVTIMASPGVFNAVRVPRLSSPSIECHGMPCGVDHAHPEHGADAVRAVERAMEQVARYR